jgi:hypothetical protein
MQLTAVFDSYMLKSISKIDGCGDHEIMKRVLIFLLLISLIPDLAFGESNRLESKNKPEILLPDAAIVSPPKAAPKETKKKKRVRSKKISFEGSSNSAIIMSEEEQKIMHARNHSDRFRTTKKKTKEL